MSHFLPFTSEFEPYPRLRSIGRAILSAQPSIVKGFAVFECHRSDGAEVALGVKVEPVINIMIRAAIIKTVPLAY